MPGSSAAQGNELPESSPPCKKLKIGVKSTDSDSNVRRSKSTKTRSKLSMLPSLPLDILFEIFGHLSPSDVLNMARATKDLRRVLMHRSAVSIWKASLRQISGLPECPQEMSEPAWVNLVFSTHCHNCFAHRVQKVDWILRIRLCKQCIKTSKILRSDEHLDSQANKLDKIIAQCVPFSSTFHIRGHRGKCCLAKQERAFRKELQSVDGDKSEFVRIRKRSTEAREAHAAKCEAWTASLNQDRWDELEEIRDRRRADIVDKLEDLGFVEELEYLEDLELSLDRVAPALILLDDHPDVKLGKPLTERSWKNMEPRLVEYMQQVKAHRVAAERLRVVRQREKIAVSSWVQFRLAYSAERLLPSGTDILSWGTVKAIIDLPSSVQTVLHDPEPVETGVIAGTLDEVESDKGRTETASVSTTISPASFTSVFSSMSGLIMRWEAKKLHELCRFNTLSAEIPFSCSPTSRDLGALRLAACVFTCEDESKIHPWIEHYQNGVYPAMYYPEFLHHPCTTVARRERGDDKDAPFNPLFEASKDFHYHRRKEWSTHSLFFDEKASRAVKRLLEACGLDYRIVTVEEMDSADPLFICLKCSYGAKCDGQRPRKVFSWRNAVQHCMRVHWGDGSVTWESITEESADLARALSAARGIDSNIWQCAHCRYSSRDRDVVKTEELVHNHLDVYHSILDPVKERDYYEAVDRPPPRTVTVQITPKTVDSAC
ncbi:hypothetical protein B0H15DRAFT_811322 [Mycena belliarum]|uniref:F-box domain-containing protein n=1 Tax=Mycena belliarum TaxID=1033014 RepID=A0AAD6XZ77_9AGAR|nr:hypothetical protein B0H15DRAFT_811322 [Mycena belliae]